VTLEERKREERKSIAHTPAPGCDACKEQRRHTPEDWKHHLNAGSGKHKEHGASK
jgi:hypothetical protein